MTRASSADQIEELQRQIEQDQGEILDLRHHSRIGETPVFEILESIADGFFVVDRRWCYVYISRLAAEMNGYAPEAMIGKNLWELFPEMLGTPLEQHYCLAMDQGIPTHFQIQSPDRDRWFDVRVNPLSTGISVIFVDCTEETQVRQQVETERDRLRSLLDSMDDEVWYALPDGTISLLNDPARTRLGLDDLDRNNFPLKEKVLDQLEILNLDHTPRPDEETPLFRSLKGETLRGEEIVLNVKTGEEMYRQYNASPIRSSSGTIHGAVAIVRDITEQMKAEQALQQTSNLLQTVLDAAPAGIVVADNQGRITISNNCAREMFGGQITGDAFGPDGRYQLCRPDGSPFPSEELPLPRSLAEGKPVGPVELRVKSSEQPDRILLASSVPLVSDCGELWGAAAVLQDITGMAAVQQELRRSEAKFARAFQSNPAAMAIVNGAGSLTDVNTSFCEISGYTRDEIIGRNAVEVGFYSLEDRAAILEIYYSQGQVRNQEITVKVKNDVSRRMLFSLDPIEVAGEPAILATMIDITERKQAEEELQSYAEQLSRSNKDLEDFAYVASHDLQEPLRKIEAFSLSLQSAATNLTEKQRDYLQRMEKAAHRMHRMVEDLLTLSRVTTQGQPFLPIDLNEIVADVVSDLELRIRQSDGRIDAGFLPLIEADPLQMRQLFLNLIGNSLKYHRMDAPPVVTISHRPLPSGMIEILIEDNGIGFDESQADVIFQAFQRLVSHSQYEGTGIGLAICRKIVERHNGTITACSTPGNGSTFKITLPNNRIFR